MRYAGAPRWGRRPRQREIILTARDDGTDSRHGLVRPAALALTKGDIFMRSRLALVAIAVSALFAIGAVTPRIASAQNKCAGTKQKETGKKANRKLKCWAKGIKKGLQADPNCLAKATFIFSSKWDKAEASQQPCTTTGDKNSMEAKVDAFVDDVVDELAGSPAGSILTTDAARTCAASKIK